MLFACKLSSYIKWILMNYEDGTYQKYKFSNSTKHIESIPTSNYISSSKGMFFETIEF